MTVVVAAKLDLRLIVAGIPRGVRVYWINWKHYRQFADPFDAHHAAAAADAAGW